MFKEIGVNPFMQMAEQGKDYKGRNVLGMALSSLFISQKTEYELHEDVDRWYAPSECHRDVNRQVERIREEAVIEAEGVANMGIEELADLVIQRTSDRWVFFHFPVLLNYVKEETRG